MARHTDADERFVEEDLADDPLLVRWTCPARSKVLHVIREDDDRPVCRGSAFVTGEICLGIDEAYATGKPFHSVCLKKLPASAKERMRELKGELQVMGGL